MYFVMCVIIQLRLLLSSSLTSYGVLSLGIDRANKSQHSHVYVSIILLLLFFFIILLSISKAVACLPTTTTLLGSWKFIKFNVKAHTNADCKLWEISCEWFVGKSDIRYMRPSRNSTGSYRLTAISYRLYGITDGNKFQFAHSTSNQINVRAPDLSSGENSMEYYPYIVASWHSSSNSCAIRRGFRTRIDIIWVMKGFVPFTCDNMETIN